MTRQQSAYSFSQSAMAGTQSQRVLPTSANFRSFSGLLDATHSNADRIRLIAERAWTRRNPYFLDDADAMLHAQVERGVSMITGTSVSTQSRAIPWE